MANIPQLSSDQWTELIERLTLHAACKLLRLHWRGILGSRGGAVPGGVEPADLASSAIVSVLDGMRAWDPQVHPDLLKFLRSVVDSKVSHLVCELENRTSRRLVPPDDSDEGAAAHGMADPGTDPTEFVRDSQVAERFRAQVLKAIEGDELALRVFECLDNDYTKPAEMAELLDLPVSEIYKAQKRLRRKVSAILIPQGKGERRG